MVRVNSLKVVNDWGGYFSLTHLDGEPLSLYVHSLEPHVEVNDHIMVLERHEVVLEVLIPALNLQAELDLHLLLVKDKSRSSQVLETGT